MSEILSRPVAEIAATLREGRVTSVALTEAAIARHQRFGEALNAYKSWAPEIARAQARAADAAWASGAALGPLQGLPISVKDLYGIEGWPTFAGTAKRLPPKWEQEGPIIRTLRRQLGVVIGKTHTVELAFGGLGVNPHWGTPRNPWDAREHRLPGGSSSGAGVSLLEGSAVLALGSDTAGSVRLPAALTGTVGLKTTHGRWPTEAIMPLSPTLDTAGLLARSVEDAAYGFAAFDGTGEDPVGFLARLRRFELAGTIIGVADPVFWQDCGPGVAEAVRAALDELVGAGARLEEAPFPEAKEAMALLLQGSVVSAECDAFLEAELPEWRATLEPIITLRIADGGALTARELLKRYRRLEAMQAGAATRFAGCAVMAAPTIPRTAPTLTEVGPIDAYRPTNMLILRNSCVANYCGLCAISLPVGLDASGLPIGLQLTAPAGEEAMLLAVALAAERQLGPPRERLGDPPLAPWN